MRTEDVVAEWGWNLTDQPDHVWAVMEPQPWRVTQMDPEAEYAGFYGLHQLCRR